MPRRRPSRAGLRRGGGFALLIVLWTLVLIAFIVAHLTASGRTEIRIAGNLVGNAVAEAAADGAVSEAIFNLSNPRADQRWLIDGTARELAIGDSRVALRLTDEGSRINPNLASPTLIEALLQVLGVEAGSANRLAGAIAEWVGSAQVAQPPAALIAEYQAAGLDYRPPVAPVETRDELGRVLGMTPAILAALRPHLTLYGPAEPNPASTDPVVAAAIARVAQASQPPVAADQGQPELATVRITARALGPGNAHATRIAIVRVGAELPNGYTVLAWGSRID